MKGFNYKGVTDNGDHFKIIKANVDDYVTIIVSDMVLRKPFISIKLLPDVLITDGTKPSDYNIEVLPKGKDYKLTIDEVEKPEYKHLASTLGTLDNKEFVFNDNLFELCRRIVPQVFDVSIMSSYKILYTFFVESLPQIERSNIPRPNGFLFGMLGDYDVIKSIITAYLETRFTKMGYEPRYHVMLYKKIVSTHLIKLDMLDNNIFFSHM